MEQAGYFGRVREGTSEKLKRRKTMLLCTWSLQRVEVEKKGLKRIAHRREVLH